MDLETLREEVRRTDMEIIDLISKRTDLAERIGRIKIAEGKPVRNVEVEEKVVKRYIDSAKDSNIDVNTLEKISKALIQEAVDREGSIPWPDSRLKKISIIGGSGKMGKWLADMFVQAGHSIVIIDPSSDNGLTIRDAADSDVVVISVPISATDSVLEQVDGVCREDALIFDLASLKSPIYDRLTEMAGRRSVCSVHPMFGPSARSMYGRNLIVCDCGNGEAVERTLELFDNRGADIRVMDLRSHDVYMSYVLGLSHAVNIAFFTVLERSGLTYGEMCSVASTTFRKNMETNESVASEDPRLYYDIQHLNANRDGLWNEFSDAVDDIKKASLSEDPAEFIRLMDAGRMYFER